jgi:superfamily II DNA or RNA helicase
MKDQIIRILEKTEELKFLVGFFYFSGWKELYSSLKEYKDISIKLLIGLEVDRLPGKILVEYGGSNSDMSQEERITHFYESLGMALNNPDMDSREFYEQIEFFMEMIESERLIIRKTKDPNHAKLYIFKHHEEERDIEGDSGRFITGSSNLTTAGLSGQLEFNVQIRDYGFDEAEAFFDQLWETATQITEVPDRRKALANFIRKKSQAADVTPFEAYMLLLKRYIDLHNQKKIKPYMEELLQKIGFKKFLYQTHAVEQAHTILETHGGVIIADVVGLGKSVIAAMLAKSLGKRGMVICPPGLIGNKDANTGWYEYINKFGLYDWEVESRGKIDKIATEYSEEFMDGIEVLIIDEAHNFRNQDTDAYAHLFSLCQGKEVILLTATPINNSPMDIFSLLNLFIVPGRSPITLDRNLLHKFRSIDSQYRNLSFINKNSNSKDKEKVTKAEKIYKDILGEPLPIDLTHVRKATKDISDEVKSIISPIMIRRNRLDIKNDAEYREEVGELSVVKDPEELFYYLDPNQAEFYDRVVSEYFADEEGAFTGAIYQPFTYEKHLQQGTELNEEDNRSFQQQKNLYDFMRRLLVKRFESSFGAFIRSIERFRTVHEIVRQFIENSGGDYILDRALMERIYELTEDEIDNELEQYKERLLSKNRPKNHKIYKVYNFDKKQDFLDDIDSDIMLFKKIEKEIQELDLISNDPKRKYVSEKVKELIKNSQSGRKVIIFTEYVATVKHLEDYFNNKLKGRVLVCDGHISRSLHNQLNEDFNAQYKEGQSNNYDLLITSDKLAEGFNLNRAGVIINYDIPWNPTRVIQRIGRINRIGMKVYDELRIFNFFPSEIGADLVRSREIAAQKMFLIHNSLGEDSKVFDPEEEPTVAGLYKRINENPEDEGELSITTIIRNEYKALSNKYPESVEKITNLPPRVKSAKADTENSINVIRRKGLSLFPLHINYESTQKEPNTLLFEELLPLIKCGIEAPKLKLSDSFWKHYENIRDYNPNSKTNTNDNSIEQKARNNLKAARRLMAKEDNSLLRFVSDLQIILKEYFTLPISILRRLSKHTLSANNPKVYHSFIKELKEVHKLLGDNYLKSIEAKVASHDEEVIIAIENRHE